MIVNNYSLTKSYKKKIEEKPISNTEIVNIIFKKLCKKKSVKILHCKKTADKFDLFQRACIILLTSWFPTGNTHRIMNENLKTAFTKQWNLIAVLKGLPLYSKTCVKWPLSKRPQIGFQDKLSHNAGQKYCRMLQVEHSAILMICIKLPFVIKIFVLSIFEWPFYAGFTVLKNCMT